MNKWLRKSLFVMVSILTFGLVSPAQLINYASAEKPSEWDRVEASPVNANLVSPVTVAEEEEFNRDEFLETLARHAEKQAYQKFGTKIKPIIENEFREVILPKIELAIAETAAQFPNENLKNLAITEQPGGGQSEKIFNVKNSLTGSDILRFHVRRDNPPQEGYWFNFHYHTYHDDFQSHHELGVIYWAKNTPPKWMS